MSTRANIDIFLYYSICTYSAVLRISPSTLQQWDSKLHLNFSDISVDFYICICDSPRSGQILNFSLWSFTIHKYYNSALLCIHPFFHLSYNVVVSPTTSELTIHFRGLNKQALHSLLFQTWGRGTLRSLACDFFELLVLIFITTCFIGTSHQRRGLYAGTLSNRYFIHSFYGDQLKKRSDLVHLTADAYPASNDIEIRAKMSTKSPSVKVLHSRRPRAKLILWCVNGVHELEQIVSTRVVAVAHCLEIIVSQSCSLVGFNYFDVSGDMLQ